MSGQTARASILLLGFHHNSLIPEAGYSQKGQNFLNHKIPKEIFSSRAPYLTRVLLILDASKSHILTVFFSCTASRIVVLVAKTVWLLRQHFEIVPNRHTGYVIQISSISNQMVYICQRSTRLGYSHSLQLPSLHDHFSIWAHHFWCHWS